MSTKATRANMRKRPGALMLCPSCLETWSASAEDYFMFSEHHVFRCPACDESCVLAIKTERYEDV